MIYMFEVLFSDAAKPEKQNLWGIIWLFLG